MAPVQIFKPVQRHVREGGALKISKADGSKYSISGRPQNKGVYGILLHQISTEAYKPTLRAVRDFVASYKGRPDPPSNQG